MDFLKLDFQHNFYQTCFQAFSIRYIFSTILSRAKTEGIVTVCNIAASTPNPSSLGKHLSIPEHCMEDSYEIH